MLEFSDTPDALRLQGDLDIYAVAEAKARLDAAEKVDLGGVGAIDGAGLQLLAWWRTGRERRRVVAASEPVRVAATAAGLDALLLEAP